MDCVGGHGHVCNGYRVVVSAEAEGYDEGFETAGKSFVSTGYSMFIWGRLDLHEKNGGDGEADDEPGVDSCAQICPTTVGRP